jgi:hypothetical protein
MVLFFVIHIAMVCLAGFAGRVRVNKTLTRRHRAIPAPGNNDNLAAQCASSRC